MSYVSLSTEFKSILDRQSSIMTEPINPVPDKSPSLLETISNIVSTGAEIYKNIELTKLADKQRELERTSGVSPSQAVSYPIIISTPERPLNQYQPLGDITKAIQQLPDVMSTIAKAPQLVEQGQGISQNIQRTAIIIVIGLIVFGLFIYLSRR